jgi:hypothetical protein
MSNIEIACTFCSVGWVIGLLALLFILADTILRRARPEAHEHQEHQDIDRPAWCRWSGAEREAQP